MEVLIVGAGAMGRWFADVLAPSEDLDTEGDGPSGVTIAFADVDPSVAGGAAAERDARTVPVDTDARFDVVCVAVPLSTAAAAIESHAPNANGAIVDVSGVMAAPVRAMREHASDRERMSIHALFAPENAPGNVAVVTDAAGPLTDRIRECLASAGNHVFETTPDEHDAAMETVQAKAHAAVLSFALAADEVPDAFHTPISAELCALADAVLDGNPSVYAEIQGAFAGATDVVAAAERIAAADTDGFEDLYRDARSRRRS